MYHKTWHIGSTFFQYPPYSENVGYWEYCFSISPLFAKNVGYWEYCFPISPLFRKCGILGNSTPNMPQFVNSMEDGKQSKPGYNVKISPFSSLQSSDSFVGPWTAYFSGSLGKRWTLGPISCQTLVPESRLTLVELVTDPCTNRMWISINTITYYHLLGL